MKKTVIYLMLTVISIMISACTASNQSAIETGIAQTLQISQLQTQAAGGENNAADVPADNSDSSVPE
jgi:type II secretory pathway component PulK